MKKTGKGKPSKKTESNNKKKTVEKDIATSRKISSFFSKKCEESAEIVNKVRVNYSSETSSASNKRKVIDSKKSSDYISKIRKINHTNISQCETPERLSERINEERIANCSKTISEKIETFPEINSPSESGTSLKSSECISPHEKITENNVSVRKSSPSISDNIFKEVVIIEQDSGHIASLERDSNLQLDLHPKTSPSNTSNSNKENALDKICDNRIESNSIDSQFIEFGAELDQLFSETWSNEYQESDLDLSDLTRCIISTVSGNETVLILYLKDEHSERKACVKCCDYWSHVRIKKGQSVVIKATKINDEWIVNNTSGILISHPDYLISGTTIVDALFCNRRTILKEKFRGFEALPQVETDGSYMTVGLLVHKIFQKALELKVDTLVGVEKIYEDVIKSFDALSLMYQCGMPIQDCRGQVRPYVYQIYNFIQRYIKITDVKQAKVERNYEGQIETIRDIEENIWLPKLGLKGKIDVSVEVRINSKRKIMPLELKTGKSSFSAEHKGQVILYTMMMSLIGQQVNSGLLLYLKENNMKEILSTRNEQRDLLMLRNTLAYYFTKVYKVDEDNFENIKELLLDLPEPINHRNACEKCPVNTLCCMYLLHDEDFRSRDSSHPLKALSDRILSHLKPEHFLYIMKWIMLQSIEEEANCVNSSMKDIWTVEPYKREKKRMCICDLRVIKTREAEGRFLHEFRKGKNSNDSVINLPDTDIDEGDYVIISSDERINICSGFVTDLNENCIVVISERNLSKKYPGIIFHVDRYFAFNSSHYNRASVSGLLIDNEICSKLRSIVIDRKPATFKKLLDRKIAPLSANIINRLNKQQQRAIFRCLTTKEYALLKGFPGTGKTRTLVALIELLVKMEKSVLVTANTHSAVDNILLGLKERNIDFLRLGSTTKIHPQLADYAEDVVTAQCKTPESLRQVYEGKKVIGVTCLGAYHKVFENRIFDMCLVDESTQAQQCTVLKPLYNAAKFLLVGDPEQLPPIVKSETARNLGINESLFARLDSENNTIVLCTQYRMNSEIMNLANKLTYKDQLVTGNEEIANATLPLTNIELLDSCELWLRATLSLKLEESVIFLNTHVPQDIKERIEFTETRNRIYTNILEASIAQYLVEFLVKFGIHYQQIGMIAPFRAQVQLLRNSLPENIEVNTVDQYQGREKNIIIYSCTESTARGSANTRAFHILEDHNRLTVAVTRAKHKLVMIGNKEILQSYSPFEKLLRFVKENNVIDLFDEKYNFKWKSLIENFNKFKS